VTARTREWLRGFLQLGARAEKDGIPPDDVERQEDTVLRALEMLEERPGIVLADEVGMGKTYEALGISAAMRHMRPRSRIVVVTPGPDLNHKWFSEFSRFREMYSFGDDVVAVRKLRDFVMNVRKHPVVVAPVTMFQSGKGSGAQTYLLSLYFHWKELHGHTANAIMARFKDGEHLRVNVKHERFLDTFDLEQVTPHLRRAFRRGRRGGAAGLDDLYEADGLLAFENEKAVRRALYRARFYLTGRLMPKIDLLIVDEAHKLKNPGSLRTSAMREVFRGRFRKALFLTATPFQLDVSELREVFSLFGDASEAPSDLLEQVEGLLASVKDYQAHYDDFQRTWSSLDPVVAARFCTAYERNPVEAEVLDEPGISVAAKQIATLRTLKDDVIQPGFRQWMIRSLREEKREYRQHLRNEIRAAGAGALPFLIYERFIAELFRRGRRTHKASVEINMVSSYAAAQQGSILSTEDGIPAEAEVYRDLLRVILGEIESSAREHPKLRDAISDSLDAADRGEKTLIFCSRIATLEQLRRELDVLWDSRIMERWRRVYPEAKAEDIFDTSEGEDKRQRGRHSLLQARFHRSQDALYLALREPYLRTLAPIADEVQNQLPKIVSSANRLLRRVRVGKTAADRLDYQLAKRSVEQASAKLWGKGRATRRGAPDALKNLLNPAFLRLGLDLKEDEYEKDSIGDEKPRWEISERVARMVVGHKGSLWERLALRLDKLETGLRVRVVEQLARYLTYKEVPFLPDLLATASEAGLSVEPVESTALLEFMPEFWSSSAGQRWVDLLGAFLDYFVQRDDRQKLEILDGPIKTGDFARHTKEGESRERLREAFNTPLYPMILIANEVMQEGLDLHKQCRRVVHHDLVWNPAQVEQRIGRIDRLGSLTSRLRESSDDVTLDVLYPVIRGTIDERLYRTVKRREKWLEFLLGAAPDFSEYNFMDEDPPPLPDRLGADLAIDLAPRAVDH
jgi:hypothetical protein